MKTFNTSKRKLNKLWNDQITQETTVDSQVSINNKIISSINKTNVINSQISNIIDLSSGWITPTAIDFDNDNEAIDAIIEYEVSLSKVDEDFTYGLRYAFLKRSGVNGEIIYTLPDNMNDRFGFVNEIIDLPNSDFKNLRIHAGMSLTDSGFDTPLPGEFSYKFIIYWINPTIFY